MLVLTQLASLPETCWVQRSKQFLTAEWRWLAMLNYEIDPALLQPFVPRDTKLDSGNGNTFVSLVGFLFLNTTSEHYWGYSAQRDGGTVEYRVEHPRWRVWQVKEARFDCDVAAIYG